MTRTRSIAAAVALACLGVACGGAPSRPTTRSVDAVAFVDVSIVDVDAGRVIEHRTVVIEDGAITAIGEASAEAVPHGARRIDGRGRFLAPGLADMHVHLDYGYELLGIPDAPPDERILGLLIAHGITTVRVPGGTPELLAWRERIARGELLGPTIVTAGPVVQDEPRWGMPTDLVRDEETARRVVRAQHQTGYDFVKVYSHLSRASYLAIVDEARAVGMPVEGHVPIGAGLEVVATSGQTAIDHAEELYNTFFAEEPDHARIPEAVALLTGRDIALVPTLITYRTVVEQWEGHLDALLARPETAPVLSVFPASRIFWTAERNPYVTVIREDPARGRAALELMHALVLALHRAGVPLLAGSDAAVPVVPFGAGLHQELECLVDVGLTPAEALRTATSNVARFLHREHESGAIAVGRRADLVLLDASPLDDIRATRAIAGVMVRGRWLDRAALDALLARALAPE
jgi:imidazolonepropionase-like amidohydrolase